MRKVSSFLNLCGSPRSNSSLGIESELVEGAMVGWAPFTLKGLHSPKKRDGRFIRFSEIETDEELQNIRDTWFNITSSSPPEETFRPLEVIAIHMYSMIVGNLFKFDHNLFLAMDGQREGQFIYIDNDRSQWSRKISKLVELDKWKGLAVVCKFPQRISHRILFFRDSNTQTEYTIGAAVLNLAQKYETTMHNIPLFTEEEAVALNANVEYLATVISYCIKQHGVENVLIPEPWPQPKPNEINQVLEKYYFNPNKENY